MHRLRRTADVEHKPRAWSPRGPPGPASSKASGGHRPRSPLRATGNMLADPGRRPEATAAPGLHQQRPAAARRASAAGRARSASPARRTSTVAAHSHQRSPRAGRADVYTDDELRARRVAQLERAALELRRAARWHEARAEAFGLECVHGSATQIQAVWRASRVRWLLRGVHAAARLIQRRLRGYWTRSGRALPRRRASPAASVRRSMTRSSAPALAVRTPMAERRVPAPARPVSVTPPISPPARAPLDSARSTGDRESARASAATGTPRAAPPRSPSPRVRSASPSRAHRGDESTELTRLSQLQAADLERRPPWVGVRSTARPPTPPLRQPARAPSPRVRPDSRAERRSSEPPPPPPTPSVPAFVRLHNAWHGRMARRDAAHKTRQQALAAAELEGCTFQPTLHAAPRARTPSPSRGRREGGGGAWSARARHAWPPRSVRLRDGEEVEDGRGSACSSEEELRDGDHRFARPSPSRLSAEAPLPRPHAHQLPPARPFSAQVSKQLLAAGTPQPF